MIISWYRRPPRSTQRMLPMPPCRPQRCSLWLTVNDVVRRSGGQFHAQLGKKSAVEWRLLPVSSGTRRNIYKAYSMVTLSSVNNDNYIKRRPINTLPRLSVSINHVKTVWMYMFQYTRYHLSLEFPSHIYTMVFYCYEIIHFLTNPRIIWLAWIILVINEINVFSSCIYKLLCLPTLPSI